MFNLCIRKIIKEQDVYLLYKKAKEINKEIIVSLFHLKHLKFILRILKSS